VARIRTAEVNGRRTRWFEAGDTGGDRVLVWLHAFPLTAEMWRPQLDALPAGWRVIAPDLAGFGGSEDHDRRPHIDDYAADLDALADLLALPAFVLGGISMGGYAAFACMRRRDDRVRALILADTRSAADAPPARAGREKLLALAQERGTHGIADEMLPKLVGRTTLDQRPELEGRVRALIHSNSSTGLARAIVRLRDRPDATPQLATLRVPVLVIVGEEDTLTPVDDVRAMASAIAGSTVVVVPAAGHLTNMENPEFFNATVVPWLAGV
jgi:3-oxoadipate enol-lactonase